MQIVINICKDDFEEICIQARMVEDTGSLFGRIRKAISHGTPLKGHGDLIDRKDLLRLESKWYHLRNGDVACPKIDIEHAQTIIEADRSEEDHGST